MDIVKLSTLIGVRNAVFDQVVTYLCKNLTPRQRAEILSLFGATVSVETLSTALALVVNQKFIKGLNAIISQLPDRREHTLKRMSISQFKEYINAIQPKQFTFKSGEDFATGTCFTLYHTFHYDSVYVDFGGFSSISFKENCTGNQITFSGVKYVQLVSANALRIVCKDYFNPNVESKFIVNFE